MKIFYHLLIVVIILNAQVLCKHRTGSTGLESEYTYQGLPTVQRKKVIPIDQDIKNIIIFSYVLALEHERSQALSTLYGAITTNQVLATQDVVLESLRTIIPILEKRKHSLSQESNWDIIIDSVKAAIAELSSGIYTKRTIIGCNCSNCKFRKVGKRL